MRHLTFFTIIVCCVICLSRPNYKLYRKDLTEFNLKESENIKGYDIIGSTFILKEKRKSVFYYNVDIKKYNDYLIIKNKINGNDICYIKNRNIYLL